MNIIETSLLTRRFGDLTAVDNLNLSIAAGEVFGLLGPNGAGKTTLVKMLTTLLPPTSGQARVAGFDVRRHAAQVRAEIGYVPQLVSVDGTLTGYENLLIFAKVYSVPRPDRQARIASALEFFGLEEAAHRQVRGYSGGMMRRLEIALAILHRPRVLFLDEPTVGLDPLARQAVWQHLRLLGQEYGMTIFLTTHFMEEADSLCGRVAIMNMGRIAALGRPEDLKVSLGRPDATLDEVFAHYTGHELDSGGNYREISRNRRTAARLG
ncbi:MAG TPA: ATP-binding cassette domain-containing protein [Patescibacteria group bacterium]|nr:ATP-binding cassette domain-containing protein [Patescibacteria group bacterium]